MFCSKCGKEINNEAKFCMACGNPTDAVADNGQKVNLNMGAAPIPSAQPAFSIPDAVPVPVPVQNQTKESNKYKVSNGPVRQGYSEKINDPMFAKYVKNSNRYAMIFSIILSVIAIVGFFIYGETSNEMDNPQALYIGFVIAGMFMLIGVYSVLCRNSGKNWDGVVVDKRIRKAKRKVSTGGDANDYYWKEYMEYTVEIKKDNGKKHEIITPEDDTVYNYYSIGDKVRHHGKLKTIEKYDKTGDSIIFCAACADINDINDDYCHRCKCPLLK